jgi:hypothetical protein
MNSFADRRLITALIIGLAAGILIGWLGIGWGLWPVEWTDANPALLHESFRADYVKMTANLYGQSLDPDEAMQRMRDWPDGAYYTCQLANLAPAGSAEKQRLLNLALVLAPDSTCDELTAAAPPPKEGRSLGNMLGLLCGAVALAMGVAGGLFFVLSRRSARAPARQQLPTGEPAASHAAGGGRAIPLAQFPTEFNIGHDAYDDSFSIETAGGEFLGECGVGISETIGVGDPKRVTAFEVWLFDKNDIRTITKVIMSEHAYYDDALRAKLAPKGEAILARPDDTVVLETASLIVNARIVEMEYGEGEPPPQSFFNRLVVELAAWAKEGALPAGVAGIGEGRDAFSL